MDTDQETAIPSQTYEAIAVEYAAAVDWMAGLGIRLQYGRTAHYDRILRYWKDNYITASGKEVEVGFPGFVSSMYEINDFILIHKALRSIHPSELAQVVTKLKRAVNGPLDAKDERPSSTDARNFLFEAATMARMHQPDFGLQSILNPPSDAGVTFLSRPIWLECKRVTSVAAIEENVRKASRQLERATSASNGIGSRGLVALEVSKIINQGDKIYVAANDVRLKNSIDRMMDDFISQNAPIWEGVYERRARKIIGTLVRFTFMATSEERKLLVYASQWAVNPRTGTSVGDFDLQNKLVETLRLADSAIQVAPTWEGG